MHPRHRECMLSARRRHGSGDRPPPCHTGSWAYGNITASAGLILATKTQMPRKEARETAEILSLRAGAGPGGGGYRPKGGSEGLVTDKLFDLLSARRRRKPHRELGMSRPA